MLKYIIYCFVKAIKRLFRERICVNIIVKKEKYRIGEYEKGLKVIVVIILVVIIGAGGFVVYKNSQAFPMIFQRLKNYTTIFKL